MIDICSALREKGVDATSFHIYSNRYNFQPDVCMNLQNTPKRGRTKKIEEMINESIKDFDIFHFHFGETFMPDKRDLELIKKAGKKMVVHHHGSEVRNLSIAQGFNNQYVTVKPEWTEDRIHKNLQLLSKYIDHAIVQDYELEAYIKDYYKYIHVIPNAVRVNDFIPKYPNKKNSLPLVVHAPTNRDLKGTTYVLNAVNQLKSAGLHLNFKLIEKVSSTDAIKLIKQADIVIDQLRIGSYGFVSTEAMAFGKPVICYIRDDLLKKYPKGLPIVNANPDTLTNVLKHLVIHPHERSLLGVKGRNYATQHHNVRKLTEEYINIYRQL